MDRIDVPTPAEEDPVLHRFLVALPRFQPAPGFETRVLTRVWRPEPVAWLRVKRRLADATQLRVLIGVLVAGAALWQGLLVTLAINNPTMTRDAWAFLLDRGLPALESWGSAALALAAQPLGQVQAWFAVWWWLGIVAAVVVLFCGAGLYATLRTGRNSHVAH